MRRKIKNILWISIGLLLLTGCQNQETTKSDEMAKTETTSEVSSNKISDNSSKASEEEDILEITEKMYVAYINEIYMNTENYLGKKIKLEGMFTSAYEESTGQTYYFVYRTGPGCCGNDGSMCGFEFTTSDAIPQENDWLEVVGTLDAYEQNGYTYLTLRDSKVTVKTERGKEVVYQ